MSGAIPPLPHTPSWRREGQIYISTFFFKTEIVLSRTRFQVSGPFLSKLTNATVLER